MISHEPVIAVGIFEQKKQIVGEFKGEFAIGEDLAHEGPFEATADGANLVLRGERIHLIAGKGEVKCRPLENGTMMLRGVTIGVQFHWQRKEDQTFRGSLRLLARGDGTVTAINEIGVEEYLKSVISSEMSAEAPPELLKAHAITSRSWLVAMLEREKKNIGVPSRRSAQSNSEIIRWYDREDHELFDVCADDHCQRYQGITKIVSSAANDAVEATRGVFLLSGGEICDARYSKACGGISEDFGYVWEERNVPYLTAVSDSSVQHPALQTEKNAQDWILGSPEAYCNTSDGDILRQVLPSFDRETTGFFRWKVEYEREELEAIIREKSGIDFGRLVNLIPIQRGASGRIVKLKIEGTGKSLMVGKELEIRRWLSKSHLYSSAFVIRVEKGSKAIPAKFVLQGAGWGHGVGLCQIGAAVMSTKGFKAEEIVKHYFRGAELKKIY